MEMDVVARRPLPGTGVSGARLEQVETSSGRVLVVKTVDPRHDWLMAATGDDGRIARLWASGLLDRLPLGVDSAIESVEPVPGGWAVVMRDVTASLVPPDRPLTRDASRQVVAAVAALHEAFAGVRLSGLCPLVERYAFLTPDAARGLDGQHPLRTPILEGWSRFADLAPAEVAGAVLEVLERPGRLASALDRFPSTVLHGDVKLANVGLDGATVVLLDWGTLTGMGPRAVDHAWYLAVNSSAIEASLDELLADSTAVLGPDDRPALPLALLGALAQLGWEKALGATSDDPTVRDREATGLAWWCAQARQALDEWSPA